MLFEAEYGRGIADGMKRVYDTTEAEIRGLRAALIKQGAALSRINYLLGPPNEMECSVYDVYPSEEMVVEDVEKLIKYLNRIAPEWRRWATNAGALRK